MALGLLLLGAALLLAVYNFYDSYRAKKEAEEALRLLAMGIGSEDSLKLYENDPDLSMPSMDIDGYSYIGVIEFADRGVSLPVIDEWSYRALRKAPCRYSGSAYTDDLILCGHNYGSHFGILGSIGKGERIRFTDAFGNEFEYEAEGTELLSGRDSERMKDGEWDLTLFTCTASGSRRITLRCRRLFDGQPQ